MGMEKLQQLMCRIGRFSRLLFGRFVEDQGLPNAASLTYTTLLSLVPLMTVSLALFSAFPISDRVAELVQDFLFQNFVPASGEILQEHFQQFSQKASQLTGPGFAFLVVVALLLMANIDRALNTIWRVRRKRSAISKFIVYWSILSLSPLLIGVSMVVTSYLVSLPLFSEAAETIGVTERLLGIAPVFASVIAFTLLYVVVPNRRVPFRHAFAGGVFAAILFELAKRGFAFYLTHFPTYEAIYGALATIPIFLVWLYLSWAITLLGAEFSCCIGIFREQISVDKGSSKNDLVLAYRLLKYLWQAQHEGETLSTKAIAFRLGHISEEHLESLLSELQQAQLVLHTEDRTWGLARDLSDVRLLDLYRTRPFQLPDSESLQGSGDSTDQSLQQIMRQVESGLSGAMGVPLDTLYSGGPVLVQADEPSRRLSGQDQ
jgi:membrane protein